MIAALFSRFTALQARDPHAPPDPDQGWLDKIGNFFLRTVDNGYNAIAERAQQGYTRASNFGGGVTQRLTRVTDFVGSVPQRATQAYQRASIRVTETCQQATEAVQGAYDDIGLNFRLRRWVNEGADPAAIRNRFEAITRILTCRANRSQDLDLSNLGLTSLPEEIGTFTHLRTLNLSGNALNSSLESIPQKLGELRDLETINFDRNQFETVPARIIGPGLRSLSMTDNPILRIPEPLGEQLLARNLFNTPQSRSSFLAARLNEWVVAGPAGERRREAADQILANQAAGTQLDLSNLLLTSLPKCIQMLPHTTSLNLRGNNFTSVPPSILGMPNLRNVHLNANPNLKITDPEWDGLQVHNHFNDEESRMGILAARLNAWVDEGVDPPSKISRRTAADAILVCKRDNSPRLDLHGLDLSSLPKCIGMLTHITSLDLSGNALASLPDTMANLNLLLSIDLSRNNFQSVPACIVGLPLESLSLKDNQLTSADAILQMGTLTSLNLANNPMTALPPDFHRLGHLRMFHPPQDAMWESQESLFAHPGLLIQSLDRWVGQAQNPVEKANRQLAAARIQLASECYLQELDLSNLGLTTLPKCIEKLPYIKSINLDDNELVSRKQIEKLMESAVCSTWGNDLKLRFSIIGYRILQMFSSLCAIFISLFSKCQPAAAVPPAPVPIVPTPGREVLLNFLYRIPPNERADFETQANLLDNPPAHRERSLDILQSVAAGERADFVAQANRIVILRPELRLSCLSVLRDAPADRRNAIVDQINDLHLPDNEIGAGLALLASVPGAQREALVGILHLVPGEQRAAFVDQGLFHLPVNVDGRTAALAILQTVPAEQRTAFIDQVNRLFTPVMTTAKKMEIIQILANMDHNDRNPFIAEINRLSDQEDAGRYEVIIALQQVDREHRTEVATRTLAVIRGPILRNIAVDGQGKARILNIVKDRTIPIDDFIRQADRILIPRMHVDGAARILETLARIPVARRAEASNLNFNNMDPDERVQRLEAFIAQVEAEALGGPDPDDDAILAQQLAEQEEAERIAADEVLAQQLAAQEALAQPLAADAPLPLPAGLNLAHAAGVNVHDLDARARHGFALLRAHQVRRAVTQAQITQAVEDFKAFLEAKPGDGRKNRAKNALVGAVPGMEAANGFFPCFIGPNQGDWSISGLMLTGEEVIGRIWLYTQTLQENERNIARDGMFSALDDSYDQMGERVCNPGKVVRLVTRALQGYLPGVVVDQQAANVVPPPVALNKQQIGAMFFAQQVHQNAPTRAALVAFANAWQAQNPNARLDLLLEAVNEYADLQELPLA